MPSVTDCRPDTRKILIAMLAEGLFLDPPLAGIEREQYTSDASALLASAADDLASRHVDLAEVKRILGDIPCNAKLAYTSIYEILTSTATLIAHTTRGRLQVDYALAREAVGRVERYLNKYNFSTFYWAYAIVATYFNLQVIRYYGKIQRRDFINGLLHRPWIADTLDEELAHLQQYDLIHQYTISDIPYIEMTGYGNYIMNVLHSALQDAQYLSRRVQLLAVSHFDSLENLDMLQAEAWPHAIEDRQQFLSMIGLRSGMRVLEAGIGTGVLTIECGLAQMVGPEGFVMGVDISVGMLERVASKLLRAGIGNVQLLQGDVQSLPFSDQSFDSALGYEFLHFTDYSKTLQELKRITKTGGTVATAGPVLFDWSVPFFQDWFEPLLNLSHETREKGARGYIPRPFEIENTFRELGFQSVRRIFTHSEWVFSEPKRVIQYMIQGVTYFRDELLELPWQAKEDLIQELYRRGQSVCERYPLAERRLHLPGEYVLGVV